MSKEKNIKQIRKLIQEMGWMCFMDKVTTVMKEQSESTTGKQSEILKACSESLELLNTLWSACGYFEYPEEMIE